MGDNRDNTVYGDSLVDAFKSRLERQLLWETNFLFWQSSHPKPWPWYKRWAYRYWTRPWRAIRHSACCGEECDGG